MADARVETLGIWLAGRRLQPVCHAAHRAAICSISAGFFGCKTQPTAFRFLLQISANGQKLCVVADLQYSLHVSVVCDALTFQQNATSALATTGGFYKGKSRVDAPVVQS
jgi:hypothetical protein